MIIRKNSMIKGFLFILILIIAVSPSRAMKPTLPVHEEIKKVFNDRNLQKTLDLAQPLAKKGDLFACHIIAILNSPYASWANMKKDPNLAVKYFRMALEGGSDISARLLGDMLETGQVVTKNLTEAFKCYERGAAMNNPACIASLGRFYKNGWTVRQDLGKALEYFRRASDLGVTEAQTNLGIMLLKGQGTGQNEAEGLLWVKRAAEAGAPQAQQMHGQAIEVGGGPVKKDLVKAWVYLSLSVRNGNAAAQESLKRVQGKLKGSQLKQAQKELAAWKASPAWKSSEPVASPAVAGGHKGPPQASSAQDDPFENEPPMTVQQIEGLILKDYF